ncbi:MAG: phosphoribosylformylglycinamidine cyclo-ligase [SAR202 cluster bacterium Casp-Chloro-G4]|nr:phosphoribosylformylglycinamidine cyclo-ligase [Chloroflexota bacterium]MDA1226711.1 phosphoribosylformylglycinamidine cyclo-ligase [Chloroflexota bacterium]PKB61189.1 MAG: phosphoribosylformylglycinamidine cyclo-ligase [SAR202 cluster bacterium Casp-Chloro-G4]
MTEQTYRAAGVNLDAAQDVKERIGAIVKPTHGPQVLGGVGGFGAMYQLAGYRDPVLVSSTDGVGTKLKLAIMLGRYDTIGEDLVNACVNDIIVCGAKPLFFLDYLAVAELEQPVVEALIQGMARACSEVDCALIGGETAQMPGLYNRGDFDMAGFVVGAVERDQILDGSTIKDGDVLIGLPSNGLHTNGYSLVRLVLGLDEDQSPLSEQVPELGKTLGEALLMPHPSYYAALAGVLPSLKGMAHITGGGLIENVPRVLPDGVSARFDTSTWSVPPIFTLLQERSSVTRDEMYRVFNMGLGMVLACDPAVADDVVRQVPDAMVVGEVFASTDDARVVL